MSWLLVGELRRVTKRTVETGPKFQVQILAEETMKNGEIRESLFTFGVEKEAEFKPLIGRRIVVDASPYPRKDGGLGISIPPDAKVFPWDAETFLLYGAENAKG